MVKHLSNIEVKQRIDDPAIIDQEDKLHDVKIQPTIQDTEK